MALGMIRGIVHKLRGRLSVIRERSFFTPSGGEMIRQRGGRGGSTLRLKYGIRIRTDNFRF